MTQCDFLAFQLHLFVILSACRPAPSQPSFLSFSEVTGGSVNVSWGAPLSPNGQLEGYRVIYQHTAPVQGLHAHLHTHTHTPKKTIGCCALTVILSFFCYRSE